MQRIEQLSLTSGVPDTDTSEPDRWHDDLFGSKMSLVWMVVATGASIILLALIGRQQQESTRLR
ncbi:MAG: hypothetical protein ACJ8CB_34665 [Ktedonobacteraceae bacterium]